MSQKYRIIFYGISSNQKEFIVQMAGMGVSPEIAEMIIIKAPVVLKEGLTRKSAKKYADAVKNAGGEVEIQGYESIDEPRNQKIIIAPFENFTMCPECGLKQYKRQVCVKCGFRLLKGLEPKNVAGH